MQITELSAGRELDALIEERIFGNPVDHEFDEPIVKARRDQYDEWGILPPYSTDIAAAWQIVETMRAGGWNFACDDIGGTPWWAEFSQAGYQRGGQARAETFPHAICLAALAALGAPPPD